MWHIDKHTADFETRYKECLLPELLKRVWRELSDNEKNVLMPYGEHDESILGKLLIASPKVLFEMNESLMKGLMPTYNDAELDDYLKALHNPKVQAGSREQSLINKYQKQLKKLHEAFDYPGQLSQNKSRSYKLVRTINRNTCVYCNRQYAFNIEKDGGSNDANRYARPALDHWFPESVYPLLSLSLYNLIPSCTICNSSAKGDTIFRLTTHVHPYNTTQNTPEWKFHYRPSSNGGWEVYLDGYADDKEERTAKAFVLEEAYQCHSQLELNDLLKVAMENGGSYLPTLFANVMHNINGVSRAEAYRILFGTEMIPNKYDNRPFSKFKKDILDQLGVRFE